MLMIMREKKYARKCAVRVLDCAFEDSPSNCERCADSLAVPPLAPRPLPPQQLRAVR